MWKVRPLYLTVILILMVVCSFSIVPTLSLNTPTKLVHSQGEITYPLAPVPQLIVNGSYLEDGLGNRVTLRGVTVDWNERVKHYGSTGKGNSPEESWFTTDDVARIKQAGGNCAVIQSLSASDIMPNRNTVNEVYFTTWIDKWVAWITQSQMYCILKIAGFDAQSLPAWLWQGVTSAPMTQAEYDAIVRNFFDLDVASQSINRDAFINLWKFIANRYKDNAFVLFGIMNEPFNHVNIPDLATANHLGQSYSTFMENIVDGIRSTGAAQIVFIDKPFLWDSSGNPTVQPVNRDSIVWEAHEYIASWSPTLQSWENSISNDVSKFVNQFGKPLCIGEYGFDPITIIHATYSNTWRTLLAQMVAFLDSQQLAGRQWHTWGYLYGEYYAFDGTSDLTAEESTWIIQTVPG
jgi:hypothetical protein